MEVEVFTDETYIEDKNFMGIGSLFISTSYKFSLIKKLSNLRCLNSKSVSWHDKYKDCSHDCSEDYHNLNNFELHFKNIDKKLSLSKMNIYKNWVKFLVNHNKKVDDKNKLIYFQILYLDLEKLDFDLFGVEKDKNNIYNRFYRTILFSANNYFFKDISISIKNLFHDIADDKQSHKYFPWHTPLILDNYDNIEIKTNEIEFIDSNHKKYDDVEMKNNAQLIQLIDVILGCSNQILFNTSSVQNKNIIASEFFPLMKRLWNNPYNYNSSFNYLKNQSIAIFPKDNKTIQKDLYGNIVETNNQFHRNLKIKNPYINNKKNESIDKWLNN